MEGDLKFLKHPAVLALMALVFLLVFWFQFGGPEQMGRIIGKIVSGYQTEIQSQ